MADYWLTHQARADLADIRHYIRRDKPIAADRQIAAIFERFRMLARHPKMGQARPDLGENLRSFSVGTYVVVYEPVRGGVRIVRVISGCRDIQSLF